MSNLLKKNRNILIINMKITRMIKAEQDIRYLRATMGVRYWVDGDYSDDNGKTWHCDFDDTDEENKRIMKLTPCVVRKDIGYRESDYWEIIIDLNEGKVLNWPQGFCLKAYYKVCDDGEYIFFDENWNNAINITKEYGQYYVPDFLAIEDNGYGDYVCINIDGDGNIENFAKMKEEIEEYFNNLEY